MDLFQPDIVLAPQFFATLRRQAPRKKGEWLLIIAVLEDAIACFQKYLFARDPHGQRLFREAWDWIMLPPPRPTPRDEDAPGFSFEYICDVLGLEPDYLRRGLRNWGDAQLADGLTQFLAGSGAANARVFHPTCFDLPAAQRPWVLGAG
ncbi:MAG: hypothetical protein H6Q33_707 [Deltaproteobacteria bacterium]|jgi:hypothetical protein|nr:hypothetical protein [Deltaproteobacteria bacterium]